MLTLSTFCCAVLITFCRFSSSFRSSSRSFNSSNCLLASSSSSCIFPSSSVSFLLFSSTSTDGWVISPTADCFELSSRCRIFSAAFSIIPISCCFFSNICWCFFASRRSFSCSFISLNRLVASSNSRCFFSSSSVSFLLFSSTSVDGWLISPTADCFELSSRCCMIPICFLTLPAACRIFSDAFRYFSLSLHSFSCSFTSFSCLVSSKKCCRFC